MIHQLDHLVLTVRDLDRTLAFYRDLLGMEEVTFGAGRKALAFGSQKINLHVVGEEIAPHAQVPAAGSADLCFLLSVSLEEALPRLRGARVELEMGPVERTGATGRIRSVYLRDPDGNLVELAESM